MQCAHRGRGRDGAHQSRTLICDLDSRLRGSDVSNAYGISSRDENRILQKKERENLPFALRLGLRMVKGLSQAGTRPCSRPAVKRHLKIYRIWSHARASTRKTEKAWPRPMRCKGSPVTVTTPGGRSAARKDRCLYFLRRAFSNPNPCCANPKRGKTSARIMQAWA
jgi:hypothetical protein